ncbi:10541_t:CDS:2, partial [Paraglomus brasilianum]
GFSTKEIYLTLPMSFRKQNVVREWVGLEIGCKSSNPKVFGETECLCDGLPKAILIKKDSDIIFDIFIIYNHTTENASTLNYYKASWGQIEICNTDCELRANPEIILC